MYTGSIGGVGGSGLCGTDGWSDALLSCVVTSPNENQEYWSYVYTFRVDEKAISHIILEVSPGLELYGRDLDYEGPKTWSPDNNSNPGLPGYIYGLKWDFKDLLEVTITIITNRAPMWGDFYAKDGKDNVDGEWQWVYAFNSMFGMSTNSPIGNGNAGGFVLVPDTTPTPAALEPGTLILLAAGLLGVGGFAKKGLKKGC